MPYEKQFTKSACRACGHFHRSWDTKPGKEPSHCVHRPPFEMANCMCESKDYIPEDNLEYLAWKYKQKHVQQPMPSL